MKTLLARRERRAWSWAELSRRTGLPVWKLRWWHRRLERGEPTRGRARGEAGTFIPVRVVEAPRAAGLALEVITPSGFRILVSAGFTADDLSRAVKAVDSAC